MNKLLCGAVLIASAIVSTALAAQAVPPPGVSQGTDPLPMPWRHAPPVIRSPFVLKNDEGRVITRDALIAHVRAMFNRLDVNHDGFITRSEVASFRGRTIPAGLRSRPASDQDPAASFERHARERPNAAAMFDRIDANHDGVISRGEFMSVHSMMAERRTMIYPHGGTMSAMAIGGREGSAAYGPGGGRDRSFLPRLFDLADANHDGRVSLEEAEAAALRHFDRADLNHDGRLTPDERRRARSSMGGHYPG